MRQTLWRKITNRKRSKVHLSQTLKVQRSTRLKMRKKAAKPRLCKMEVNQRKVLKVNPRLWMKQGTVKRDLLVLK